MACPLFCKFLLLVLSSLIPGLQSRTWSDLRNLLAHDASSTCSHNCPSILVYFLRRFQNSVILVWNFN